MIRTAYLAVMLITTAFISISCVEEPPEYESYPAESIRAAVALPEGGFVLAGVRSSSGSGGAWAASSCPPIQYDNLYVLRVDDAGDILWEHDVLLRDSLEPIQNIVDQMAIAITPGGDIAIAGGGYNGVFVVRTDLSGTLLSMRIFNDALSLSPAVTPTADGGFLFAGIFGHNYDSVAVLRTDGLDQEVFRRSEYIGYAWHDRHYLHIADVKDEGFFLVMSSRVIKFAANGDPRLTVMNPLNGTQLYAVVPEPDGGMTVAGIGNSEFGWGTMTLQRLGANAECLWSCEYDVAYDQLTRALVKTYSCGYALAGMTHDSIQDMQPCLLQTDANGLMTTFGIIDVGNNEYLYTLCNAPDGGFLLGGQTDNNGNHDAVIVRTTSQGNKLWSKTFGL